MCRIVLRKILLVGMFLFSLVVCADELWPLSDDLSSDDVDNEVIRGVRSRFPEADRDGDGVLTEAEARRALDWFRQLGADLDLTVEREKRGHRNISYGPHPRQRFDLWLPETTGPVPVWVFIHGGSFNSGDKSVARQMRLPARLLEAGVAVLAMNYRFRDDTMLPEILRDGANLLAHVEQHAAAFNIDPGRIAIMGNSAGAGIALWTAFQAQFEGVVAVVAQLPQASYDEAEVRAIMGDLPSGMFPDPAAYLGDVADEDEREALDDLSLLGMITSNAPPILLLNRYEDVPPADIAAYKHHPRHVRALQARLAERRVPHNVILRDQWFHDDYVEARTLLFLLRHLNAGPGDRPDGADALPYSTP